MFVIAIQTKLVQNQSARLVFRSKFLRPNFDLLLNFFVLHFYLIPGHGGLIPSVQAIWSLRILLCLQFLYNWFSSKFNRVHGHVFLFLAPIGTLYINMCRYWSTYRVIFSLVPPNFSTKKKTAKQSIMAFLSNRIYWNSSCDWLIGNFLFGTKIGGY